MNQFEQNLITDLKKTHDNLDKLQNQLGRQKEDNFPEWLLNNLTTGGRDDSDALIINLETLNDRFRQFPEVPYFRDMTEVYAFIISLIIERNHLKENLNNKVANMFEETFAIDIDMAQHIAKVLIN